MNSQGRQKKILVRLFAFFRENRFREQEMEFPAGASVRDVILSLNIPVDEVGVTMINNRHCTLDQIPVQGDAVAIFPVIGGG